MKNNDDLSYPPNWFLQTWGGLSLRVRGVRVQAGWWEGLLRVAYIGVGIRVASRVGQQARGRVRGRVFEKDHFLHTDAVSLVEIHQPVEGAEGLVPDAVLTATLENSEMFHSFTVAAQKRWWRRMHVKGKGNKRRYALLYVPTPDASSFLSLFLCVGIHTVQPVCIPLALWEMRPQASACVGVSPNSSQSVFSQVINLIWQHWHTSEQTHITLLWTSLWSSQLSS